jgi:hypothetical protein
MFRAYRAGIVVSVWVLAVSGLAPAQLDIKTYEFGKNAHGFHGLPLNRRITTFQAESEAVRVFQQIMGAQGLSAKIEIRASGDVENAAAFLDDAGTRIIAYNVLFMDEVKKKTGRYWSLISIMAHEVGHHLNFHTYVKGMPSPEQSRKDELEADYFSGHALARLGASLDEALAAMRAISPLEESSTHPGRDARLQVIALGWKSAGTHPADAEATKTGSSTQPKPETVRVRVSALIDGRSIINIRNNRLWWHHLDWAAPGREGGRNEATIINGAKWYPTWPAQWDRDVRCGDCVSSFFDLSSIGVHLGATPILQTFTAIKARSSKAFVKTSPAAANGYLTEIELDDNALISADLYEVLLEFSALGEARR